MYITFFTGIYFEPLELVAMRKYKNISKVCTNCNLILSTFGLLLFLIFMNCATPLNLHNSEYVKALSRNKENIQDEYNYEFYMNSAKDLASHLPTNPDNSFCCITINDSDENNSIKIASDNYSIEPDIDNTVKENFTKQLISQAKLPAERALRSDILLI